MKKYALPTFLFLVFPFISKGQGCSDAGFCTMGSMRPGQIYSRQINFKLKELELNYYNGKTNLTPTVQVVTLDFTFGINERNNFQLKVPYQFVSGNLGSTSGIGDLSASFSTNIYSSDNAHINGTLGMKIPSGKSDLDQKANTQFTTDGDPHDLPMYYQISLGTWDIVGGASYSSNKWMFATGFQIPLNENENEFRHDEWTRYHDQNYLMDNHEAYHLKRGSDVMLRAERTFLFSKLDFRIGLLPIFRITKDEVLDVDTNQRVKLEGTTGMALSALFNVAYHFNTTHSIKFLGGVKLTDRDVNPDGLTRKHVISLAYVARF